MSSIPRSGVSVSSPVVPTDTAGQRNLVDSLQLPMVCVGCYAEANRELPQNCQMTPCPRHAHQRHPNAILLQRVHALCTALVAVHAPAPLIKLLQTAATLDAVLIALGAVRFWLAPQRIEVQR